MDIWQGPMLGAILIGIPLVVFLIIKLMFARTHKAYWTYMALLAVIGVLALILVNQSDFVTEADWAEVEKQPPPDFGRLLSQMPIVQVVLLALAGGLWIVGGNVLIVWQKRKAGRSWMEAFNPFGPVFRDFDGKAWKILGFLVFASMVLGMAAISMTKSNDRELGGVTESGQPASFFSTDQTAN